MSDQTPDVRIPQLADEARRIREIYKERKEPGGPLDLYGLLALQERQECLLLFLRDIGLTSLRDLKILDIGCGSGSMLRRFFDFGAQPGNCFGIDLLDKSLRGARQLNPNIAFVEGTAAQLPFRDGQFDLVHQSTVFTSVLNDGIRCAIAAEIMRTLRPGGCFVWYDFAYSNPRNPNVRGIGKAEIRKLFNGCGFRFHRVTLAPPIGRVAVHVSPYLYRALSLMPLLRTHYLCLVQKLGVPVTDQN